MVDSGCNINKLLLNTITFILALYAVTSMGVATLNNFKPTGGTDLYTYWRVNHFIRQGEDPYKEFLDGSLIRLPKTYIYGATATDYPIADTGVSQKYPANSPIMLFLLFPLSYFSWESAKLIFLIINLILALVTPWIVFKLWPGNIWWTWKLILAFSYYGLPGTRSAIVTGQTSMTVICLVFLTMILARSNRRFLGGILLGIALAKFSVAIPCLIFLAVKKNWWIIGISFVLQFSGFLGLAWLRQESPIRVMDDYITIASAHTDMEGIHLTGLLNPSLSVSLIVATFFSILVVIGLRWVFVVLKVNRPSEEMRDYMMFGILSIWGLLVAYHRGYDLGMALVSLVALVHVANHPSRWGFKHISTWPILCFFLVVGGLSIPTKHIQTYFLPYWEAIVTGITTLTLILLLVLSLVLTTCLHRVNRQPGSCRKRLI